MKKKIAENKLKLKRNIQRIPTVAKTCARIKLVNSIHELKENTRQLDSKYHFFYFHSFFI